MKIKFIFAVAITALIMSGCGIVEPQATQNNESISDSIQQDGLENNEDSSVGETGVIIGEIVEDLTEDNSEDIETERNEENSEESCEDSRLRSFSICFAGDISLADNSVTMEKLKRSEGVLEECISADYLEVMRSADICVVNNEFCYTERGEQTKGKTYHFRGAPENVEYLLEMGVDIVDLANNHVYDYGRDGFIDTLDTIDSAGILRVGAGMDLEEASAPLYVEIDGVRVAFVAASRAEKNIKTPNATENSEGIMYCYDNTLFLEEIKEARENADIVIAILHWGAEYNHKLEEVQQVTGHEYIDAGADAVIGGHTHCLQGIELYNGRPILYSLGNFWFNSKTLDTMLAELEITVEGDSVNIVTRVVPGIQAEGRVQMATDESERERIFRFLEGLSPDIRIDDSGVICSEVTMD